MLEDQVLLKNPNALVTGKMVVPVTPARYESDGSSSASDAEVDLSNLV